MHCTMNFNVLHSSAKPVLNIVEKDEVAHKTVCWLLFVAIHDYGEYLLNVGSW